MKRPIMLASVLAALAAPPLLAASMPDDEMMRHMKEMRAQMEEIRRTTDPVKRDELITAHMKSMHEGMSRMHAMEGGDGKGASMKGGCMGMMGGMQGAPSGSDKPDDHGHGH